MFNPTNLDEVCVQATHIESKGKSTPNNFSLDESNQWNEGKEKGKGKHATTMRKGEERPTSSHCQKQGHEEAKCWVTTSRIETKVV